MIKGIAADSTAAVGQFLSRYGNEETRVGGGAPTLVSSFGA